MPLSRSPTQQPPIRDQRGRFISPGQAAPATEELGIPHYDEDNDNPLQEEGNIAKEDEIDALKDNVIRMQDSFAQMQEMMRTLIFNQQTMMESQAAQPIIEAAPRAPSPALSNGSNESKRSTASSISGYLSSMAKEALKDVPNYDGDTRKPHKLFEFIAKIESFMEVGDELTSTQIRGIAERKLTDYAYTWWLKHIRSNPKDSKTRIQTWEQMKEALLKTFVPEEYIRSLRFKLVELKQTGSIS